MSGEQITTKELNFNPSAQEKKLNHISKVNINDLLHRVRQERNKEKKENYIFLGIICVVITATGIIASI